MSRFARDLSSEIAGYDVCTRKLRSGETLATSHALMGAAVVCLLRAAIVPWALHYTGGTSPGAPSDVEIVITSVLMMCVFGMASMCARVAPVAAVVISLMIFGAVCAHDVVQYANILQQGLISKVTLGLILLRALMNAVMSRTM